MSEQKGNQGASAEPTGLSQAEPEGGLGPTGFDPSRVRRPALSVYEKPIPAILVLTDALDITVDEARSGLRALVDAGYGIAPRLPTNGMLAAYIEATPPPKHHDAVITAIGKARVRWAAMLAQGTGMALSLKYIPRDNDPDAETGCADDQTFANTSVEALRQFLRDSDGSRNGRDGEAGDAQ